MYITKSNHTDTAVSDATIPDAAIPNAAFPDAAFHDAAISYAVISDATIHDAAVPDAASVISTKPFHHSNTSIGNFRTSPFTVLSSARACLLRLLPNFETWTQRSKSTT